MKHVSLSVVAAVALGLSSTASADLIQVDLSGTVSSESFSSGVLNQAVFISFIYDTATAPTGGDGTTFSLYPAATLLSFTIGALSWSDTGGSQSVFNFGIGVDVYTPSWAASGPSLGGLDPVFIVIDFDGNDVLSFTELPDLAELLQLAPSGFMTFGDGQSVITFDFETFSAVIVPLPPAVWAGLAGLVLVVGVRRLGWLF